MLQFVSCSGAAPGNDIQTRRTVRSQAMRHYRRTQRAEREAAIQSPATTGRASKRAKSVRREGHNALSDPSKATEGWRSTSVLDSNNDRVNQALTRRVTTKRALSGEKPNNNRDPTTKEGVNDRGRAPQQGLPIRPNNASQEHLDRKSIQQSVSAGSKIEGFADPFPSAAVLNRMSDFCKTYVKWLQPALDAETIGVVLSKVWEQSQRPILLAACYLAAAAHMHAVDRNEPIGDNAIYKARILEDATLLMRNPETATSNEAIGTLACLQSFEMSRCNREATTHLQGLRSIIDMKGGLDSIIEHNLLEMVQTLDLLHAVVFDSQPLVTVSEASPERNGTAEDLFIQFTAMLAAENQSSLDLPAPLYSHLENLSGCFERLLAVLSGSDSSSVGQGISSHNDADQRAPEQSLDLFSQIDSTAGAEISGHDHFVRALHCAFAILHNVISHRAPFRCWGNREAVKKLYASVRRMGDETRVETIYHWLWILVTGVSASQDVQIIAYLQAHFTRLIYRVDAREFRRVKEFLLNFIDLKEALQRFERGVTVPDPIIMARASRTPSHLLPSSGAPPQHAILGKGCSPRNSPINKYVERSASTFFAQARQRKHVMRDDFDTIVVD